MVRCETIERMQAYASVCWKDVEKVWLCAKGEPPRAVDNRNVSTVAVNQGARCRCPPVLRGATEGNRRRGQVKERAREYASASKYTGGHRRWRRTNRQRKRDGKETERRLGDKSSDGRLRFLCDWTVSSGVHVVASENKNGGRLMKERVICFSLSPQPYGRQRERSHWRSSHRRGSLPLPLIRRSYVDGYVLSNNFHTSIWRIAPVSHPDPPTIQCFSEQFITHAGR